MDDKLKFIKFKKLTDKNRIDIMLDQSKISLEYNINSLKNEIINKWREINEKWNNDNM